MIQIVALGFVFLSSFSQATGGSVRVEYRAECELGAVHRQTGRPLESKLKFEIEFLNLPASLYSVTGSDEWYQIQSLRIRSTRESESSFELRQTEFPLSVRLHLCGASDLPFKDPYGVWRATGVRFFFQNFDHRYLNEWLLEMGASEVSDADLPEEILKYRMLRQLNSRNLNNVLAKIEVGQINGHCGAVDQDAVFPQTLFTLKDYVIRAEECQAYRRDRASGRWIDLNSSQF